LTVCHGAGAAFAGGLSKDAVEEACKKAVDNFFAKGLTGQDGKVVVELPPREPLTGAKLNSPAPAP
jgi:hypothetical protein